MQNRLFNNYTINLSSLIIKLAISTGITGTFILSSQPVQAFTELSESKVTSVTLAKGARQKSLPVASLASLKKSNATKVPKKIFTLGTSSQEENNLSKTTILIQSNLNTDETRAIPELPALKITQNPSPKEQLKQIHSVQAGETITSIAGKYGISKQELLKANKIGNPNLIAIDDKLILPLNDSDAKSQPRNISNLNLNDSSQSNSPKHEAFKESNQVRVTVPQVPQPALNVGQPIQLLPLANNNLSPLDSKNTVVASERSLKPAVESKSSQNSTLDPYITKLRADIVKLRTQYQTQVADNTAKSSVKATELTNNPESDELLATSSVTPTSTQNQLPQEKSVSLTPISANGYNEILQLSAANSVTPQLPPLSSPEEYLPNSYVKGYIWPAKGTFTSGYGWRWGRMHKGIDIAAPIGTPIVAAASGEVISAGWNSGGYGNLVKVRHPDGSVTFYAHNNRIYVRRGQRVRQGQQIAEMGSTGYSTGPHLHFEIRTNRNVAVNPVAHLPRNRKLK